MGKVQWLTSEDPAGPLFYLSSLSLFQSQQDATERKLRLIACAFRRLFSSPLTYPWDPDNGWSYMEVDGAKIAGSTSVGAADVSLFLAHGDSLWERRIKADIVRDVVGDRVSDYANLPLPVWVRPRWVTPQVEQLAQVAHRYRIKGDCKWCSESVRSHPFDGCPVCKSTGVMESGQLDTLILMALADAAEEAGCADEPILRHLRNDTFCRMCFGQGCTHCSGTGWIKSNEVHVRGCWAVDYILGKGLGIEL